MTGLYPSLWLRMQRKSSEVLACSVVVLMVSGVRYLSLAVAGVATENDNCTVTRNGSPAIREDRNTIFRQT